MEVLQDFRVKAADPYNFLYGPYLAVTPLHDDKGLRVGVVETIEGGTTVYAIDQFAALLDAIEESAADVRPLRLTSRPAT